MSNDNANNSVQSIKKRFEQQILNNEKDKSHAIIKSNSKSAYNSSIAEETRVKHVPHNDGNENNVLAKSSSLETCSRNAKDSCSESVFISEQEKINFVFNRPHIDPKRKSQIRRKPAFRCTDNKHNPSDKESDNSANNRSFLFRHAESSDKVKKSPVFARTNLEKIEKSISNPPPSVLFALMKKNPTSAPNTNSHGNKKAENANPDVNHMLKKLEELLVSDKTAKKNNAATKFTDVDPEALKLESINSSALNSIKPNKSDKLNLKTFNSNPVPCDKKLFQRPSFKNLEKVCDKTNNLQNGNPIQNLPVYAISSKSRKTEPVYAEPFQFLQKEKSIDVHQISKKSVKNKSKFFDFCVDEFSDGIDKRNSAYAVSPIKQDLHYLCTNIYDIPTENPRLPEVVDFNIIKQECRQNQRGRCNSYKKHCNDSSTEIHENSSEGNQISSINEDSPNSSTKPIPRPRNLKLITVTPFYCNNLNFEKENFEDNLRKMEDSGMSSMEASPDLEDIEISRTPSRSLTEKRKNYLTRVSSVTHYDWVENLRDKRSLNSCYTALRKKSAAAIKKLRQNDIAGEAVSERLFEACLLVGYNSLKKGYVKSIFPPEAKAPEHIEHLIFPQKYYSSALRCTKSKSLHNIPLQSKTSEQGSHNKNKRENQSSQFALKNSASQYNFRGKLLPQSNKLTQDEQNYSIVLTDQNGIRKFGYCRKILPENSEIYLPLVYCIVTNIRAPGFYFKILQELESRHGQTDYQHKSMLQQFYVSRLPKPGQHLFIKIPKSPQKRPKTAIINEKDVDNYFIKSDVRRSFNTLDNKRSVRDLNSSFNSICANDSTAINQRNLSKTDALPEYQQSAKPDEFTTHYGKICTSKSLPKISNSNNNNDPMKIISDKKVEGSEMNCDTENLKNIINTSKKETNECDSLKSCDNIFKKPLILKSKFKDFQQNDFIQERKNSLQNFEDIRLAKDMEYLTISTKDKCIPENEDTKNSNKKDDSSDLDSNIDSMDDERFSIINSSLFEGLQESKHFTEVVIKRPYDVRLENNELAVLFESLNIETIINVFGSLLIERKVILVCESLSKLCACIEGLQSALYPFRWQHTLVTTLPHNLIEITNAPMPILAGILCTDERILVDEGILVDADTSQTLICMKDENTLLPSMLREKLKLSLSLVKNTTGPQDPTRNVLVGEAFLKFFVTCMQGYVECFHNGVFDKQEFIECQISNKQLRSFLEWFVETAMFNDFIKTKSKILINLSLKHRDSNDGSSISQNSLESDEYLDLSYNTESFNHSSQKIDEDNSFYEMFDGRLMERNKNTDSTKSFLKNHKNMTKKSKTFTEKFKEFLHS